jgi:UDP-N-acetylmuramoyl-L-alanyl-D-glutamate--2,6-diaminopimelate ligase
VAQNSSLVKPGYLFAALNGQKFNGLDFAQDALSKGAVALLVSKESIEQAKKFGLPILVCSDPLLVLGDTCQRVFDISGLRLFAVTGTNGKTSTVSYLAWLLEKLGLSTGFSASTMRKLGNQVLESNLTTPQVSEVYELLSQMKRAGNQAAVFEVSAQALIRHRVDGLRFEISGFTNLSRDHLDDFSSMNDYLEAKKLLFTKHSQFSVINVEDEYGRALAESLPDSVTIGSSGSWTYQASSGIPARLSANFDSQHFECEVPAGSLMAKNLALAVAIALSAGFQGSEIQKALEKVDLVVPGRLQRVSEKSPAVFVDYAHTPAGVEAAVAELRKSYGHLVVVLAASGNRDQGKRPAMAHAASSADLVVVTDQHPRDEDPALIRATLVSSLLEELPPQNVVEIADPKAAIAHAISSASANGAVLWCGPGHLKYREVAGVKVPFDALAIAKDLVEGKS